MDKIKKISAIISLIYIIPAAAFASISYTVSPSYLDDTQTPVAGSVSTELRVSCDQLNAFTYTEASAPIAYANCGTDVFMVNSTSDILSGARIYNTGEDIDCTGETETTCAGWAEEFITINTQAVSAGGMFTIPTGATTQLLAYLGDQIADTGTIAIIGIAGGIYLAFYIMDKIIHLLQPARVEDKDK